MNKLQTETLPIKTLPSGEELSLKIIKIKGSLPGPKIHIQSSVHGAELQGNAVIYELLQYFMNNDFKGEVQIIPMANPAASSHKMGSYTYGRFNPITGENWNRAYEDIFGESNLKKATSISDFVNSNKEMPHEEITRLFKTHLRENIEKLERVLFEYGKSEDKFLFLTLQKLASESDCVLDLHTAPVGTRYIYTPEYALENAKKLLFPHYLIIPNEFGKAMDEATFMPWIHLKNELKKHDIEYNVPFQSFTIELGGEERISFSEAKDDAARILSYLHSEWKMITTPIEAVDTKEQYACNLSDYKTYHTDKGGLYDLVANPGELIKKGEVLAKGLDYSADTIRNLNSADDVYFELKAKQDCIVINNFGTSSIPSGAEVFQVMENYFTL